MERHHAHRPIAARKTWTECGACFALSVATLGAIAVGLQWVLHFVP
jgi:hypothetical protein